MNAITVHVTVDKATMAQSCKLDIKNCAIFNALKNAGLKPVEVSGKGIAFGEYRDDARGIVPWMTHITMPAPMHKWMIAWDAGMPTDAMQFDIEFKGRQPTRILNMEFGNIASVVIALPAPVTVEVSEPMHWFTVQQLTRDEVSR